MSPHRAIAAAILLALAGAAARAAAAPSTGSRGESGGPTLERVSLQLKWKHQFQFAGYYAALEEGYYREAGLDVEIREAPDTGDVPEIVARGGADYGIATSDLVVARAAGLPVVALAPIFQHSPNALIVTASSGVESVHDLAGRRIMVDGNDAEILAYLKSEGIGPGAFVRVPHTFDASALFAGTIAAISGYITDEPFLLEERGVAWRSFSPRAAGIDFYGDTLFTTEGEVRARPDRVRRFVDASLRGWRHALAHPEEMADLIHARYGRRHSRAHLLFEAEVSRRLILPDVVEVGYVNPGRWRHIADVYAEIGVVPRDLPLEGFVWERGARPTPWWLVGALAGALSALALASAAALRFYRLSVAVRAQAKSLERALAEIRTLRGIIPICSHCKKVRTGDGAWSQLERYVAEHTEARFSHGICEGCLAEHYGDVGGRAPPPGRSIPK
jgi:ABC-type nitrate/sulfonate/bicarbonate transport system substrate-binding protein